MRRYALALLAATATLAVIAQPITTAAQSRRAERAAMQTLAYGTDEEQQLDFWPGATADAPLVLFVHGGGWKRGDKGMMRGSDKLEHWQAAGYAVASINYRLVPDHTVEQQGADVASAVAFLRDRAGTLGFDRSRIALIGHSAGAHLVALVGTDPQYFRAAGLAMNDVVGVTGPGMMCPTRWPTRSGFWAIPMNRLSGPIPRASGPCLPLSTPPRPTRPSS